MNKRRVFALFLIVLMAVSFFRFTPKAEAAIGDLNILWWDDEYRLYHDPWGSSVSQLMDIAVSHNFTSIAYIIGGFGEDGNVSISQRYDVADVPIDPAPIIAAAHAVGLDVYFALYAAYWEEEDPFPHFNESDVRDTMVSNVSDIFTTYGFDGFIDDCETDWHGPAYLPSAYWTGMVTYLDAVATANPTKTIGKYWITESGTLSTLIGTLDSASIDFFNPSFGANSDDSEDCWDACVSLDNDWILATYAYEDEDHWSYWVDWYETHEYPANQLGFSCWTYYYFTATDQWDDWDSWELIASEMYFSDGFESGNFNAWSDIAGSPSVVTTLPYFGTYHMSATNTYNYVYYTFTATDEIYARAYVYFVNLPTVAYEQVQFMRIYDTNGDRTGISIAVKKNDTTNEWMISYFNADQTWVTSTQELPENETWYCVEIHVKLSETVGQVNTYINGTELTDLTATGLNTISTTANEFTTGCIYEDMTESVTVYVDCVVVSDSYIGTIEETIWVSTLSVTSPTSTTYNGTIPVILSNTGNDTGSTYSWNVMYSNSSWVYLENGTSSDTTIELTYDDEYTFCCNLTGLHETYDYGEVVFTVELEPEPTPTPPPVASGFQTLYIRSDLYTTFNTTGYGLGTSNTAATQTLTEEGVSGTAYFGFRIWIVNQAGYTTEVTAGTPVAVMNRSVNGAGIQQATYAFAVDRSVSVGAVALQVKVYIRDGVEGEWQAKGTFISMALLTTQIETSTWTFSLYTIRSYGVAGFSFGSSLAESKIAGLSLIEPDWWDMMPYYFFNGNYLMFVLYPYTRLIGMGPFASIILLGFGITAYVRFRSFYFILLVMVALSLGGVLNLIMGDALWGSVALLATFALGALYWRVFR